MKKNKSIDWKNYDPNDFFDELIAAKGKPRPAATAITDYLGNLGSEEIQARQQAAELGSPVTNMVLPDNLMTTKRKYSGNSISNDG